MRKRTTVAIAHSDADLGKPAEHTRQQVDRVKQVIREIDDLSMAGFHNIVKKGQGTDQDQYGDSRAGQRRLHHGSPHARCTNRAGTGAAARADPDRRALSRGRRHQKGHGRLRHHTEVARRTGAQLCPFDTIPFDMYNTGRPVSFNEFPVPRPVREADAYIGVPKMKRHIHATVTNALKLQFGNLPNYDWMARCHRDDIYQKIANLTRAANPKWFVADALYTCQGNGPFSAYAEDVIKDFNVMYGGADPVAVDTVCEALMDWDNHQQ